MIVDTLAIVGTGLIGGSFSLALKQAGVVRTVLGVGRNPARLTVARELGLIDRAVDWAGAGQADCILLALPVGETEAILKNLAPHLPIEFRIKSGTYFRWEPSEKAAGREVADANDQCHGQRRTQCRNGRRHCSFQVTLPR